MGKILAFCSACFGGKKKIINTKTNELVICRTCKGEEVVSKPSN